MAGWPFSVVLVGAGTPLGRLLDAQLAVAGFAVSRPDATLLKNPEWVACFEQPQPPALVLAATPDSDPAAVAAVIGSLTPVSAPALILALSGSQVFAGDKSGFYNENDLPDAHSDEAQPWLALERWIGYFERHYLLRSDRVFSAEGDNPLTRLLHALRTQHALHISSHMRGCPTPASDLARVMTALLQQAGCGAKNWGTLHYCSGDVTHCAEFIEAVLTHTRQFESLADVALQPLAAEADRQRPALLACQRIRDCFGIKQRSWRSSLPVVIKQYFAGQAKGQS